MNKSQLIIAMADAANMSKADAELALGAFTGSVSQALAEGESVNLPGFGKFEVKERSARTGRNPQTGETIQIPAAQVPSFKAGQQLKDAVN